MPKQTAEIMIRQNKMKMPFAVIVHGRRGPARSPAAMRRPPPICMLYPVARVIFIFLEMTLVMSPPKAVQHALRRIIPSPRIVISAKKSSPGLMLMETIAAIPRTQPRAFFQVMRSSAKIAVERMISRKPPMESRIVDLALLLKPRPT